MSAADRISALIAAKNLGGAWQAAEDATGVSMTYIQFLAAYVWGQK